MPSPFFSGSPTLHLSRIQGFVGLLTFTFRCNLFNCTTARISPSLRAITALPMTGFRRTHLNQPVLTCVQKRYFVITATKGAIPLPRVQEFHLIPLFSREQEYVSEASLHLRVAHLPQKPFSYSIIHRNKNRLPSLAVYAFS